MNSTTQYELREKLRDLKKPTKTDFRYSIEAYEDDLVDLFNKALQLAVIEQTSKVDRFEVIDDSGRAYVKGSIYGSPVSVELSYQDEGRTLKVFVTAQKQELTKGENV